MAMSMSRQSVVDTLRRLGFTDEADEASRVLPDPVELDRLMEFSNLHGISRDELIGRMGGSP
jgi:hypothetical protein